MKKLIASFGLTLGFFGLLTAAPAQALPPQDSQYLACIEQGWGHASRNPLATIDWGHQIAEVIQNGGTPVEERDYLVRNTDIANQSDATVMVNCATQTYLGKGASVS